VASLTLSYWTRDASLPGPAVCSADVDASSFDFLPALQTLRIVIHRRKAAVLKFLFILVRILFCSG